MIDKKDIEVSIMTMPDGATIVTGTLRIASCRKLPPFDAEELPEYVYQDWITRAANEVRIEISENINQSAGVFRSGARSLYANDDTSRRSEAKRRILSQPFA